MRLSVFVSYAREDTEAKERLLADLAPLVRNGTLDVWHDAELLPGAEFNDEIRARIEAADLVLCLISRSFLASEYCDLELRTAMARDDARVIPIVVGACDWESRPFAARYNVVRPGQDVSAELRRAVGALWRRMSNLSPRDPDFTGREDLLASMGAETCVLTGMDGVGKAQLALEYAHRHTEEYSILWWIRGDHPTALASGYAALAEELELPERTLENQLEVAQAVRRYLAATPRWLLVFENVATPEALVPFLPGGNNGRAIVTTRNALWRGAGATVAVDVMARPDAVALLLRRSGSDEREAADALANDLGDLPLALVQAGASVHASGLTLEEYTKLFRTRRREMRDQRAVAATLALAIEDLRAHDAAAADLLPMCAFLAAGDIPRALLHEFVDELAVNDAVGAWRRHSLASTRPGAVKMHSFVQFAVRGLLTVEETARWARAACAAVNQLFPMQPQDSREWPAADRLLPHVRAACALAEEAGADNDGAAPLLNRAGMYLRHRRISEAALEVYQAAERWLLRFRGPDHPALPALRSNIATLLGDSGGRGGSIETYRAALEHDQRVHGERHPAVGLDLSNLATALIEANRPAEALPLLRQAEALFDAIGAADYPHAYAATKTNLGTALLRLGRGEEATPELESALATKEKLYGPDNAILLPTLTSLVMASGEERHCTRALRLAEQHFGVVEAYRLRVDFVLHAARTGDLHDAVAAFKTLLSEALDHIDAATLSPAVAAFADILESREQPGAAEAFRNVAAQLAASGEEGEVSHVTEAPAAPARHRGT